MVSTKFCSSFNTDCGVFGGWPYLAYQYIMKLVSLSNFMGWLFDIMVCRVAWNLKTIILTVVALGSAFPVKLQVTTKPVVGLLYLPLHVRREKAV